MEEEDAAFDEELERELRRVATACGGSIPLGSFFIHRPDLKRGLGTRKLKDFVDARPALFELQGSDDTGERSFGGHDTVLRVKKPLVSQEDGRTGVVSETVAGKTALNTLEKACVAELLRFEAKFGKKAMLVSSAALNFKMRKRLRTAFTLAPHPALQRAVAAGLSGGGAGSRLAGNAGEEEGGEPPAVGTHPTARGSTASKADGCIRAHEDVVVDDEGSTTVGSGESGLKNESQNRGFEQHPADDAPTPHHADCLLGVPSGSTPSVPQLADGSLIVEAPATGRTEGDSVLAAQQTEPQKGQQDATVALPVATAFARYLVYFFESRPHAFALTSDAEKAPWCERHAHSELTGQRCPCNTWVTVTPETVRDVQGDTGIEGGSGAGEGQEGESRAERKRKEREEGLEARLKALMRGTNPRKGVDLAWLGQDNRVQKGLIGRPLRAVLQGLDAFEVVRSNPDEASEPKWVVKLAHTAQKTEGDRKPPRQSSTEPRDNPWPHPPIPDEHLTIVGQASGLKAVAKPPGISTQYLLHCIQHKYSSPVISISRLDKDTSGVLPYATSKESETYMKTQYLEHSVRKRYLALCIGFPPVAGRVENRLLISDAPGKNRVRVHKNGKVAISEWNVMRRYARVEATRETHAVVHALWRKLNGADGTRRTGPAQVEEPQPGQSDVDACMQSSDDTSHTDRLVGSGGRNLVPCKRACASAEGASDIASAESLRKRAKGAAESKKAREGCREPSLLDRVLQYYLPPATGAQRFSLVEVRPLTGRTHQIRVHMQSKGHPLASDAKYAKPSAVAKHVKWCERMFLHCASVQGRDMDGNEFAFDAQLPDDLARTLRRLLPLSDC
ncbi:MATH and LRR domain-containing protein [Diplonema papillatum]|nr:MATH and LRR domain-containing protein [Diplonema papillatum]|eukprot:gene9330-14462_t